MTLSDVFYEAACMMSTGVPSGTTDALANVNASSSQINKFLELMAAECPETIYEDITVAANTVDWNRTDFRTFMLLMASEAVRV